MESNLIEEFVKQVYQDPKTLPYLIGSKSKPENFIPYSGALWDEKEIMAIFKAIVNGKWFPSGGEVAKFEAKFSKMFNFKSSLMVNSGSSADLLMIAAIKSVLKWQDGDEVILSVVGFPTTLSSLTINNLKPVFCDIEMDSLNFDISKIESLITPKTRAIYISPVLGNTPDMDALVALKEKYQIELILDNCDSLGSKWKDKFLSDYCIASSCSFYMAHHISTGEGGMISSNDERIAEEARKMCWWGRDCYCVGKNNTLPCGTCKTRFSKWIKEYDYEIDHRYYFTATGYNLKPLDFQGSIGIEQLEKFEFIEAKRIEYKNRIESFFKSSVQGLKFIKELDGAHTSWFGVPVICDTPQLKRKLVDYLEKNNIQTRNYFAGNILLQPAYKHLGDWKEYPNASKVLDLVFFVGCAPFYDEKNLEYIEKTLKNFKSTLNVLKD
jgi:CDP-6-deoxy-D-xylo-4-hexulose-3-dehydrase